MGTVDPPDGFDASFFDWLETMGEELLMRFIDRGNLQASQIDELERELGEQVPLQIRVYYENCNPWGLWKEPRSVWQRVKDKAKNISGITGPLLPIDINSLQGNYVVACLQGKDKYEIVSIRKNGSFRKYKDLKSFFIKWVKEEVKSS